MIDHDSFKHSILIVEDDGELRSPARTALEEAGFWVAEASSGKGAMESLEREKPTLILMGTKITGMGAFELCSVIRGMPGFSNLPIVMVLAQEDTESINRAYEVGATDFIANRDGWPMLSHRIRYIIRTHQISQGLRESEAKNRAFIQAIPDTMLVVDKIGGLVAQYGGRGNRLLFDLKKSGKPSILEALPKKLAQHWQEQIALVLSTGETQSGEFKLTKKNTSRNYETRMVPYTADSVLIMIRDISEQKQATQKVRQLAFYDTLTGLPNRQSFLTQLAAAIRNCEAAGTMLAILYIDLDHFKRINDSLGHNVGDQLLKDVAKRLGSAVRKDDYVARYGRGNSQLQLARLGGDEFTIILGDVHNAEEAETIAERIAESLSKPLAHDGHEFVITPSIGIAVYPDDGTDIDTLVKNADVAMYQAKAAGRNNHCMFSGTMSVRSLERMELEDALRRTLSNGDLELNFQPKMRLASGEVTGMEALLRWNHPERGAISPEKFIPMAEEANLIIELSEWVLNAACGQLKAWQDTPLAGIPVAINLSGQQFYHGDVHSDVVRALTHADIAPSLLELELTESMLMRDAAETVASLRRLKEAGLSLAVDDFGTGYSSLAYLKKFPIDALKIDKSFVSELKAGGEDASICSAIIALAHNLGLKVIAEGVETEEQLELLKRYACDEIQGYFFAKPMSADDVAQFVRACLAAGGKDLEPQLASA